MTEPLTPIRLADIRDRHESYVLSHSHPGAFACCLAHGSADDVPVLLGEIERLQARVAELEAGRNRINDLPPSKQTLAAIRIIRRPGRRAQQDGGEIDA